jgi:hypothetical protein
MALITLPNSAEWDTEKRMDEQTVEAQEYAHGMIDSGEIIGQRQEELCGQNLQNEDVNRPTKKVYEDAPNNRRLEENISYVHGAGHKASFAVSGRTWTMIDTSI